MKKYRFFVLTLLFASILASLTSYNVSAITLGVTYSRDYNAGGSTLVYHQVYPNDIDTGVSGNNIHNGSLSFGISANSIQVSAIYRVVLAYSTVIYADSISYIPYRVCFNYPPDTASWVGFSGNGSNGTAILSDEFTFVDSSCLTGNVSFYNSSNLTYAYLGANTGGVIAGAFNNGFSIVFGKTSSIRLSGNNTYADALEAVKNNTNNINDILGSMSGDLGSLRSAQEQEAQTAQDTYDKTIEDEQTASSSAGGFSFNFSIPNPFEIFRVSDGCVSTPTIDSWLHLEGDWQSPHCPVIPAEVRNTLTPVVTLIVTLATLLVVIRWVSGTAVDVAGNSSWLNDKPEKGAK